MFQGLYHSVSLASQCTSSGRFPNDAVPGCRAYTMCIDGGNGNFIDYNLTCPPSFIFSPLENVCTNVTNYQCLDMLLPFNCTGIGNFENLHTHDCKSYIACVQGLNDTVSPRLIECSNDKLFDPVQRFCVSKMEFQCKIEVSMPTAKPDVQVGNGIPHVNGVIQPNGALSVRAVSSTLFFILFSCMIV